MVQRPTRLLVVERKEGRTIVRLVRGTHAGQLRAAGHARGRHVTRRHIARRVGRGVDGHASSLLGMFAGLRIGIDPETGLKVRLDVVRRDGTWIIERLREERAEAQFHVVHTHAEQIVWVLRVVRKIKRGGGKVEMRRVLLLLGGLGIGIDVELRLRVG